MLARQGSAKHREAQEYEEDLSSELVGAAAAAMDQPAEIAAEVAASLR